MLKRVVDNLDQVEEQFRALYKKDDKDGKFYLQTDDDGLATAFRKEKEERQKLADNLKTMQDSIAGIDLTAAKKALDDKKAAETKALEAKGEFETIKTQMVTAHATELAKKDDAIKAVRTRAEKLFIDREIMNALADPDIKGNPALLSHVLRGRVKLEEEGDEFKIVVLDAKGGPMIDAKTGDPLGVKALAMALREEPQYQAAFEAKAKSGSGARPGGDKGKQTGSAKSVESTDMAGLSANLEGLAKGEVTVAGME